MRDGFFPLHRKFFDHWLWTEDREYSKAEAWIDILSSCAIAPVKRVIQGVVVHTKEGEIVASERFFSARWKWSRTKVRHFISLLQAEGMVRLRYEGKDQQKTILSVLNYERYALRGNEKEPQKDHPSTTRVPPGNQIGERRERREQENGTAHAEPAPTPLDFLEELKPLYPHVNFDAEFNKMRAWLLTPKGRNRKLTKGFVVNWLNKIDTPIQPSRKETAPPAATAEPPGWREWVLEQYPDAKITCWRDLMNDVKQEFADATPHLQWKGLRWNESR